MCFTSEDIKSKNGRTELQFKVRCDRDEILIRVKSQNDGDISVGTTIQLNHDVILEYFPKIIEAVKASKITIEKDKQEALALLEEKREFAKALEARDFDTMMKSYKKRGFPITREELEQDYDNMKRSFYEEFGHEIKAH